MSTDKYHKNPYEHGPSWFHISFLWLWIRTRNEGKSSCVYKNRSFSFITTTLYNLIYSLRYAACSLSIRSASESNGWYFFLLSLMSICTCDYVEMIGGMRLLDECMHSSSLHAIPKMKCFCMIWHMDPCALKFTTQLGFRSSSNNRYWYGFYGYNT